MNSVALLTGGICMAIPLMLYIPEIKKADSFKERCSIIIDLICDPFVGLTSLFYLGFLLVLVGLFVS